MSSRAILLNLALLLAVRAPAQRPAEKRLGLVIGLAGYSEVPSLAQSLSDADKIALALRTTGFAVDVIKEAGRTEIDEGLRQFARKIGPGDVVFVYYAGHGAQREGINYLVPLDFPGTNASLAMHAVRLDQLVEQIGAANPRLKIFAFDACRTSGINSTTGKSGLAEMSASAFAGGTYIAMSAAAGQEAQDGLFAKHLETALDEPGLSVADLFMKVRSGVQTESKGRQRPVATDGLVEPKFYFRPGGGPSLSSMSVEDMRDELLQAFAKIDFQRQTIADYRKQLAAYGQAGSMPAAFAELEQQIRLAGPKISLARSTPTKPNLSAALREARAILAVIDSFGKQSIQAQQSTAEGTRKALEQVENLTAYYEKAQQAARASADAMMWQQFTIEPWERGQYLVNTPFQHAEFSTDGGKTFSSMQMRQPVNAADPLSLIVRRLDESGKELERKDQTSIVKTQLSRHARERIPGLYKQQLHNSTWGCNLYGCSFMEYHGENGFCHVGVRRAWLSDSQTQFTFEVDRSACSQQVATVCHDFPNLPFGIQPGKSVYAKFEMVDGSSFVHAIPVGTQVLEEQNFGRFPSTGFAEIANWTVLESLQGRGKGPFAAITYVPPGQQTYSGGFALFVGLRGCASDGSQVRKDGWLVDEDGKGLLRQRINGQPIPPGFGPQFGARVSPERIAELASKDATIHVAADTEKRGRLGPYTYRFSPRDLVQKAVTRAKKAALRCDQRHLPRFTCVAEETISFLKVREVRFGGVSGKWTDVVPVTFGLADYLNYHNGSGMPPIQFEPPKDWADLFHQILFSDGTVSEIERVAIR